MKRFMFVGVVMASISLGVLLGCTEVFTMTKGGSKQLIITADTQTGKIVSIADENANSATRVDPEEMQKIYGSPDGLKYVGTILYGHSSPGCYYVISGGWAYKICWD